MTPCRLWCDGYAHLVHVLVHTVFLHNRAGRNGGHLTANAFQEFAAYSALFGTDDAKRAIALEKRTVAEIVKIVNDSGKEAALDLVPGGRNHLLFTEPEVVEANLDYEAAKKAGIDLSDVEFLTKEQVEEVSAPAGSLHSDY